MMDFVDYAWLGRCAAAIRARCRTVVSHYDLSIAGLNPNVFGAGLS